MSLAPANGPSCTRGMGKSECATQECTLATVERGAVVEIVDVLAEHPEALLVHGIRPGVRLTLEGDAPFGGPRIVRIGGCRVAVDRRLTRAVHVRRARGDEASEPAAGR